MHTERPLRLRIAGNTYQLVNLPEGWLSALHFFAFADLSDRPDEAGWTLEIGPGCVEGGNLPGAIAFTEGNASGWIVMQQRQAFLDLSADMTEWVANYFLRTVLALDVFARGGLLLHAAGILQNGQVDVFYGHSGSGKTTVSKMRPDGASLLSDDLVALLPGASGWEAHATPFWSDSELSGVNDRGLLHGIYRLVKDQRNDREPVPAAAAVAELIGSMPVLNARADDLPRLLERCRELTAVVPCYRLHFQKNPSFWDCVA